MTTVDKICDYMQKQFNKELIEEYPFLLPKYFDTDKLPENYDYEYTYLDMIPKGWIDLFLQLCEDLKIQLRKDNFLDKFQFTYIDIKDNGELRINTAGCSNDVYWLIEKYCYISKFVCQECGRPAKLYKIGTYVESMCKSCAKNHQKEYNIIPTPVGTKYKRYINYVKYYNGFKDKIKVDTKDIWNRLFSYV